MRKPPLIILSIVILSGENQDFATNLLLMGATLGINGTPKPGAKELLNVIFNGSPMENIYSMVSMGATEDLYSALEMLINADYDCAISMLAYILCFGYLDGSIDDAVAERLDKMLFGDPELDARLTELERKLAELERDITDAIDQIESEQPPKEELVFTFDEGVSVSGTGYSIAIPDGFRVRQNMEVESLGGKTTREFIAWTPKTIAPKDWDESKADISVFWCTCFNDNPVELYRKTEEMKDAFEKSTNDKMFFKPFTYGDLCGGYMEQKIHEGPVNYHCYVGDDRHTCQFRIIINKPYSAKSVDKAVEDWLQTMKCNFSAADEERTTRLTEERQGILLRVINGDDFRKPTRPSQPVKKEDTSEYQEKRKEFDEQLAEIQPLKEEMAKISPKISAARTKVADLESTIKRMKRSRGSYLFISFYRFCKYLLPLHCQLYDFLNTSRKEKTAVGGRQFSGMFSVFQAADGNYTNAVLTAIRIISSSGEHHQK